MYSYSNIFLGEKGAVLEETTYHEAPFLQALTTLDRQQHQLYLKSTPEMAHQPANTFKHNVYINVEAPKTTLDINMPG